MNVPGSTVATSGPFDEGIGDSLAIAVSRSKLEIIATSCDNGIAGNKCRAFCPTDCGPVERFDRLVRIDLREGRAQSEEIALHSESTNLSLTISAKTE